MLTYKLFIITRNKYHNIFNISNPNNLLSKFVQPNFYLRFFTPSISHLGYTS